MNNIILLLSIMMLIRINASFKIFSSARKIRHNINRYAKFIEFTMEEYPFPFMFVLFN